MADVEDSRKGITCEIYWRGLGEGLAQVAKNLARGVRVACAVLDMLEWFPNNVARNFHVNLSSIEIALLELQRFWRMLKIQGRELRARFVGSGSSGWLIADG